jgi:hypothetical protein
MPNVAKLLLAGFEHGEARQSSTPRPEYLAVQLRDLRHQFWLALHALLELRNNLGPGSVSADLDGIAEWTWTAPHRCQRAASGGEQPKGDS